MAYLLRSTAMGAVLAGVLLTAAPASAAIITYSSFATWNANVSGVATDNFSDITTQSTHVGLDGFTRFTGVNLLGLFNDGTSETTKGGAVGTPTFGKVFVGGYQAESNGHLQVTLPAGTKAVGFNLATFWPSALTSTATINIAGNLYTITNLPRDTTQNWFGFTSDTAITSFTISTSAGGAAIANLSLATAGQSGSPVGEVSTLWMLGSGISAAVLYSRRRERSRLLPV